MRNSVKAAVLVLMLSATGCSRAALPIAVFAAAATIHTVQAVDAYCSQEDVDCTKGSGPRAVHYETHDDPYSTAVDW